MKSQGLSPGWKGSAPATAVPNWSEEGHRRICRYGHPPRCLVQSSRQACLSARIRLASGTPVLDLTRHMPVVEIQTEAGGLGRGEGECATFFPPRGFTPAPPPRRNARPKFNVLSWQQRAGKLPRGSPACQAVDALLPAIGRFHLMIFGVWKPRMSRSYQLVDSQSYDLALKLSIAKGQAGSPILYLTKAGSFTLPKIRNKLKAQEALSFHRMVHQFRIAKTR